MNPIAISTGSTVIYWSAVVIALGIAAGFALSYSLYISHGGRSAAMWLLLPLALPVLMNPKLAVAALPLLAGNSTLHLIPPVESRSYIDMTRSVQAAFGVQSHWLDENTLAIPGGQHYHPCDYTVEGDYSQAAFPAVLGAVTGGVAITGLSEETLQGDAAILEILRRCGARFTRTGQGVVFEKAPLHGTDIDLADCPDLGPVLMVLGLLCEGTTVIRNAERLRIKESDRIEAMETELRACGGQLESEGGTITIHGCAGALHAPEQPLSGHNDHRVVMSLAVLALAAGLELSIDDAEAVQKSWPHFFEAIKPLGAEVEYAG